MVWRVPESRLKIGAVSYLNTKPLVFGLERRLPHARIEFDLPSRLADGLAAGEYDVALIPSVEYFRGVGERIVSDACIACRGPVWSVKLLSRVPCDRIRTLALDEGSRTSAALVQTLLHRRFGLRPKLDPFPIDRRLDDVTSDAVVVIGDRAMHIDERPWRETWDLGDHWNRLAETPFVFAMWVAGAWANVPSAADRVGELESALQAARDEGVAHASALARKHAVEHGLTETECLGYFVKNLHFVLGPRERRGLEQFRDWAAVLGLIPESTTRRPSPGPMLPK